MVKTIQHCECGSETFRIVMESRTSEVWAECEKCGRPSSTFGVGEEKQKEWMEKQA